jgi:hypothetical protein
MPIWLSPLWRRSATPASAICEFLSIIEVIRALTKSRQPGFCKNKRVNNPYEFEPGTPYVVEDARQTTFSDFVGNETSVPIPAMGAIHMKNSLSEGNAVYLTRKKTPLNVTQSYPSGHALYRSESSPRLNSGRSPERHNRSPSPGISGYYAEDEASAAPAHRGRSRSRNPVGRDHPRHDDNAFSTPSRQRPANTSTTEDFCSPAHVQSQSHGSNRFPPRSSSPTRPSTRSPTRILDRVSEHAEYSSKLNETDLSGNQTPSPPKKRSRSPMKRMFGEHGWLGRSPDELQVGKHSSKKSSAGRKEKSSVMGKLRSKIEELVSVVIIIARNLILTARDTG